jgi:hypothetical protein
VWWFRLRRGHLLDVLFIAPVVYSSHLPLTDHTCLLDHLRCMDICAYNLMKFDPTLGSLSHQKILAK